MSPRIPAELARLDQALASLEAAVGDVTQTRTRLRSVEAVADNAIDVSDVARRVDRVIDRLETVLGE